MTRLDLIKDFIKLKGVNSVFMRKELMEYCKNVGGLAVADSQKISNTIDVFCSQLQKLGYIAREQYGISRIMKLVPEALDVALLKKQYDAVREQEIVAKSNKVILRDGPDTPKLGALSMQEGGSHYKHFTMQPIELIVEAKLSFIEGNIVKYIMRYKYKNGIEDIKKCIHYAMLAIDLKAHGARFSKKLVLADQFCKINNASSYQNYIILHTIKGNWNLVISSCNQLIKDLQANANNQ